MTRLRLALLQGERDTNAQGLDDLRSLRRAHPDVAIVLVRRRIAPWQWDVREVARLVDEVVRVDPLDVEGAAAELVGRGRGRRLDGVLTVHEDCLAAAAEVADRLALPGPGRDAVRRCRDKWALAGALRAAGVPTPPSRLVTSAAEARAAARELGWPVVLKPRDMAASIGVVLARHERELGAHYAIVAGARWPAATLGGVIVQAFVEGPALAANAYVERGAFRWVCHSEKRTTPPPFFLTVEDTLAERPAAPSWLVELAARAVRAAGIEHGVVHLELVAAAGGPSVIEVTPRPGGGFVRPSVQAHAGVDLLAAAVDLALGRSPRAPGTGRRGVVARNLLATRAGRLGRIVPPDPLPPGCRATWCKGSGDAVELPPRDYFPSLGFVVAEAATVAEARRRLDEVEAGLRAPIHGRLDPRGVAALVGRLASPALCGRILAGLRGGRFGGPPAR